VTIRVLGGLLSAYTISRGDTLYLKKAVDLGERLIKSFHPATGLPLAQTDLRSTSGVVQGTLSLAEVGALSLELKYLAYVSRQKKFWDAAERISQTLIRNMPADGLMPDRVNIATGALEGHTVHMGGGADSFYEYLAKQYVLTKQSQPQYLQAFQTTMNAMMQRMLFKTPLSQLVYFSRLVNGTPQSVFSLLSCTMGASLSLVATGGKSLEQRPLDTDVDKQYFWVSKELTKTCMAMYRKSRIQLAPEAIVMQHSMHIPDVSVSMKQQPVNKKSRTERRDLNDADDAIVQFHDQSDTSQQDDLRDIHPVQGQVHHHLRPEAIEALFYLWRATGDVQYREWGWQIVQSIQSHAAVSTGGYVSLEDVVSNPPRPKNHVEPFFMAETLKYLFLLFSDDSVLPLDQFVFNTEAHPFPTFTPPKEWL
jgi:mannosyl-oligosaccharide alpha-1,2-mannosidase